jgi:hypothetical protein
VEGRAWPRLNCLVIVASDADTNGYREKSTKSRESVPAASLRIGTGLGEIRGRHANETTWEQFGSISSMDAHFEFRQYERWLGIPSRNLGSVGLMPPCAKSIKCCRYESAHRLWENEA